MRLCFNTDGLGYNAVKESSMNRLLVSAASKARDTQTVVNIEIPNMPDFYKK